MNETPPDSAFVRVTPAGCFHAVEHANASPERRWLQGLMKSASTPTVESARKTGESWLQPLLSANLLECVPDQEHLPDSNLPRFLPTVLPSLSTRQRVVLTESGQGLYLDFAGVSQPEAEELSALAAEVRDVAERRRTLLQDHLSVSSSAFAIVDGAGNSDLGFWPLHIGDNMFTLTIQGIPRFNTQAFRWLVWVLCERYGEDPVAHAL